MAEPISPPPAQKPRIPTHNRLDETEDARRRGAYDATRSDREAAERLGLLPATFAAWRRTCGLPAKYERPHGVPMAEEARRRAAYEATRTDGEAARLLGMRLSTFQVWRSKHLPPKVARRRSSPSEDARRKTAYHASASDAEAARRVGISPSAFEGWRKRAGLPPKRPRGQPNLDAADEALRRDAFLRTANDWEAARRLGMNRITFQGWRAKRGLQPQHLANRTYVARIEERRRVETYEQCLSDEEAARLLHMDVAAYRGWRIRRDLPPARPRELPEAEHARRRRAYGVAQNDREAALLLGLTKDAYASWRRDANLPPRGNAPEHLSVVDQAHRLAAYRATRSDRDAAQVLGIRPATFQAWRIHRGLPARNARRPALPATEEHRRMEAYWASATDQEALRRMGLSPAGYRTWRNSRGLPCRSTGRSPALAARRRFTRQERERIIRTSASEEEAAARLGVQTQSIRAWKARRGLVSPRPETKPVHPPEPTPAAAPADT